MGDTPRSERRRGDRRREPKPLPPGGWPERARDICLRLLTMRPRTRAELADGLARREVPPEVIAEVLDRYAEVGMIDDAAFADAWVASRHRGKGLARRALGEELRRKGVDRELSALALEQLDEETERETARDLVRRRLRGMGPSVTAEAKTRRLAGMLGRKGYSPGLAMSVVREALAAQGDDADEEDDGWAAAD